MISGALLYIRDDFEQVDKQTWLQVMFFLCAALVFVKWDPNFGVI